MWWINNGIPTITNWYLAITEILVFLNWIIDLSELNNVIIGWDALIQPKILGTWKNNKIASKCWQQHWNIDLKTEQIKWFDTFSSVTNNIKFLRTSKILNWQLSLEGTDNPNYQTRFRRLSHARLLLFREIPCY